MTLWRRARRHPLVACVALAAAVRLSCAAVTQHVTIFPSYYFNDAMIIDKYGWGLARHWRHGEDYTWPGAVDGMAQAAFVGSVYFLFGHRPFAVKALNSLLAALAVGVFGWLATRCWGARAGRGASLALAVWPSHVFFTSQALKDSVAILLVYAALAATIRALDSRRPRARFMAFFVYFTALLGAGLFRSYLLMTVSTACALACACAVWRGVGPRRRRAPAAVWLLLVIAVPAVFPFVCRALTRPAADSGELLTLIPTSYDPSPTAGRLTLDPAAISDFRRSRQRQDRDLALQHENRRIETQLFPDLQLRGWLDLFAFLPKGVFYVLFMPLPLLYPSAGKLGRILSSWENVALLAAAVLALRNLAQLRLNPQRALPLLFFGGMAAGSALLEFDLGSAARHRLLHAPVLFALAAAEKRKTAPMRDR